MDKNSYGNNSNTIRDIPENEEIDLKNILVRILRKKNWFTLTAGLVFSGSLLFTVYSRIFNPIYQGSFSILISDPMNNIKDRSYENLYADIAENNTEYDISTLIILLKSSIFLSPISEEFNISVDSLRNKIFIDQNIKDTKKTPKGIINVKLNFNNKKEGLLILERLSQNYLKASLDQKQKSINEGLKFLNSQAPEIIKRRNSLQNDLLAFQEKNKLMLPSQEINIIKEQQNNIENEKINLIAERDRLQDIKSEILNGSLTARGFKKEMKDGLSISDFDQGLLQQLIEVENEIAIAKTKFTDNSSIVKGLNSRLKQIQPILLKNQLEAVDTALKLNQGSLNSLNQQKEELEIKFLEQPILMKEYKNIEQDLEIANNNLLSLISAKENFQLAMAQNTVPWRIISKPKIDENPIAPNIGRNLVLGFLGSLLSGSLIALIRDRLDNIFYTPEEVREEINLISLAHLPYVNLFKDVRDEQKSIIDILENNIFESTEDSKEDQFQRIFFQEAFRNLYTSIRFLDSNQNQKIINIVSSIPKEGKSLTNILLAKTLSDLGIKVLLIDADMRKPEIHVRLGLNNLLGFSNLLIEKDINLDKVIQKFPKRDNFFIITGGKIPPDPTRLLRSKRCKEVMKNLGESKQFEVILVDSPPLLGLADSLLISEYVDGVILLIGLGTVKRDLPRNAINELRNVGANIYGFVTNQTKEDSGLKNSPYGYGYGYGETYKNYLINNVDSNNVNNKINENIEEMNNLKLIFEKIKNFTKSNVSNLVKWLDG